MVNHGPLLRQEFPHLTLLASYDLPFYRDRHDVVGQLLGGWKIAATLRYASGTPFTVITALVSTV